MIEIQTRNILNISLECDCCTCLPDLTLREKQMETKNRMLREYLNLVGVGSNMKANCSDEVNNISSSPDIIIAV
jgi:hypothetical protein